MAKKTIPEKIRRKDILEEVHFEIDKNAFKGPFTCCGKKTKHVKKKLSRNGLEATYYVWQCFKCKKEYLDFYQSEELEKFWLLEKQLDDKLINMERKMNFDGKTYFFRFPREITKNWSKNCLADIKVIDTHRFIVEVRNC